MDEVSRDILQEPIAQVEHLLARGEYAEARRAIKSFMRLKMAKRVKMQLQVMLSGSYLAEGQWQKGLRILYPLETKVLEGKDSETAALVLNRIAFCLVFKGNISDAARYYRRSLRICEQGGILSDTVANNISDLAYIDRLRGDYRKALSGYERAIQACDDISSMPARVRALHNIARLKSLLAETNAAIVDANEAFSLASETGHKPLTIDCLWLLGLLLFEKGDIPEGLRHMKRAAQESGSIGGSSFVRVAVAYVRVLTWIGAFDEAKLWGENALAAARRLKQVLGIAHCHLLLARIRLLENDYVATLHYAREAKNLFHSSADHVKKARALICETEALIRVQQFRQARKTLETAVSMTGKTDDVILKSDCRVAEASLLLAQGEFRQSTASALRRFYKRLKSRHVHKCLEAGYHLAAMLMLGGKEENVLSVTQELFESSQAIIVSLPEEYQNSYQNHPLTRAIVELSLRTRLKKALRCSSVEEMMDTVDEFREFTIRTRRPSARTRTKLVHRSDSMRELVRAAEGIAPMDAPVLITGETGVGKEVLARGIHHLSIRKGSFVPLNCAAVPSSLIESELFGYAKGAFTGADADKKGLFLSADNGTLFLDEIGNMPLDMQAKLLRVLEESRIRPVGSTEQIPVNVRILSATNRDLRHEVEKGRFRDDLFYRINAITMKIPPLRERREDIPALVEHFIKESGKKIEITEDALQALTQYNWPGNVRELESEISHLIYVSGGTIEKNMLKKDIKEPPKASLPSGTLQEMERNLIKEVLEETGYNKQQTARLLGIAKSTLYEKMKRYGIDSTESIPRSEIDR